MPAAAWGGSQAPEIKCPPHPAVPVSLHLMMFLKITWQSRKSQPLPQLPPFSEPACEVPGSELLTLFKPLMSTKEGAKAQDGQEVCPSLQSLGGLGPQEGWAGEATQALMGPV